jgi:hypothetical protein
MNASKVIAGLIALFVTLPIWFYLLYKILDMVHATELMWFLYWIYVPATIFATSIARLTTKEY